MERLCSSNSHFCPSWHLSHCRDLFIRPSVVILCHTFFYILTFEAELFFLRPLRATVKFPTAEHLYFFWIYIVLFILDGVLLILFVERVKRYGF